MKHLLLLIILAPLYFSAFPQSSSTVLRMNSIYTSFPDTGRVNGHLYHNVNYGKQEHYNDSSVLILIPSSFHPSRKVNFIFWFHGWNNNIDTALSYYHLHQQFEQSGSNAILVLAETARNAPDSYGGKLERPAIFKGLVADVLNKLKSASFIPKKSGIGKVILAGHSGAYRVMASIISRGGVAINEVILFDALYANTQEFKSWTMANNQHRFINLFTSVGGTDGESELMMQSLKIDNVPFSYFEEKNMTPELIMKNRIIFIHSGREHNDIIFDPDNFRTFLQNGILKK